MYAAAEHCSLLQSIKSFSACHLQGVRCISFVCCRTGLTMKALPRCLVARTFLRTRCCLKRIIATDQACSTLRKTGICRACMRVPPCCFGSAQVLCQSNGAQQRT